MIYCAMISAADILNNNSYVYYFPNYPNILYMYIEYIIDKMSNNKKYNIEKKIYNHYDTNCSL